MRFHFGYRQHLAAQETQGFLRFLEPEGGERGAGERCGVGAQHAPALVGAFRAQVVLEPANSIRDRCVISLDARGAESLNCERGGIGFDHVADAPTRIWNAVTTEIRVAGLAALLVLEPTNR